MRKTLLFITRDSRFFMSHRMDLAMAAKSAGFSISVACDCRDSQSWNAIEEAGFTLYKIPFQNLEGKIRLLREIKALFLIFKIFFSHRPQLCHAITIKSVLYGGLISLIFRVPFVALVAGQGGFLKAVHSQNGLIYRAFRWIYRIVFYRQKVCAVFQNESDLNDFITSKFIRKSQAFLIQGSGVNIRQFRYRKGSECLDQRKRVIMASRLIKEKGVFEFCMASRLILQRGYDVDFQLYGEPDTSNPKSFTSEEIEKLCQENGVQRMGHCHDMAAALLNATVFCLPSYYPEGLPKAILEAMSVGCPVVATDIPGCRTAIQHNQTGILVPPRNVEALVTAIVSLLDSQEVCEIMATKARVVVEHRFTTDRINSEYLGVYNSMLNQTARA